MSPDPAGEKRGPAGSDEAAREAESTPDKGYPNPQGDDALDEEDAVQEAQETPGMGS
jgi:hypothetical protein